MSSHGADGRRPAARPATGTDPETLRDRFLDDRPPDAPDRGGAAGPKVCLVCNSFYPYFAGGALRFQRYLPGFLARGIDVHVLTGTPVEDHPAFGRPVARGRSESVSVEVVGGVPVYRVPLPRRRSLRRHVAFGRALVRHCRRPETRPDVLHLADLPFFTAAWLPMIRALGIPVLRTHTINAPGGDGPIGRALERTKVSFPARMFDWGVVGSVAMREHLRRLGDRGPLQVIGHGVDLRRFRPPAGEAERGRIRDDLGMDRDALVLLYVGAVNHRKGTDRLLEAWSLVAARWPGAHLWIVGPPPTGRAESASEIAPRLAKLETASGDAGRVHVTGLVARPELFYRAADVFVFPSRREGVPNAVLEAMASRLPVVLTAFTGLTPELGSAGREYVLSDPEPGRLAATVESLLSNEALRTRLGSRGRAWVEGHMDVERSIDAYVALYRRLAARGRVGRIRRTMARLREPVAGGRRECW